MVSTLLAGCQQAAGRLPAELSELPAELPEQPAELPELPPEEEFTYIQYDVYSPPAMGLLVHF